ncbi:hypothetical protein [Proteus terrae]|uniref:tail fiber/spike domain-containing protein n=1 Tax=Proteus terrae TaxID=1574161 RepID=UPI0034D47705
MSTIPTLNPVPSEAAKDLKFNSGKIDEFVTSMKNKYIDRFGQEHFTIEGLRWVTQQAISQFGYITLDSFQKGAEITLPNQVLRDEITGEYYRWDGELPKLVLAGSTPDSSGGISVGAWVGVGDAALRSQLNSNNGASMIFSKNGTSLQENIEPNKIICGNGKNEISSQDIQEWVNNIKSTNSGYFVFPAGNYSIKEIIGNSLISIDTGNYGGKVVIDFRYANISYDGENIVEYGLLIKGKLRDFKIINLFIQCNNKINYGVISDENIGLGKFENIIIENPVLDGFNLSAWQVEFHNCYVWMPGRDGFSVNKNLGTSTSWLFSTCWVKEPKRYGYNLSDITYLNFINSAFDGGNRIDKKSKAVIGISGFVYGLNINGMGTENVNCPLIYGEDGTSIRSLTLTNWYIWRYGDKLNPVDYLFDLYSGTSVSINGLNFLDANYNNSGRFRNPTDGKCTVYSSDDTLKKWVNTRNSSFSTSKESYTSARLPFSTNSGKAIYTINSESELLSAISEISYYVIDCDVDIIINVSLVLSNTIYLRYIDGGGVIRIKGTNKDINIRASKGVAIYLKNNSTKIIFENLTLSSPSTGSYGVFSEIEGSLVSFNSCVINSSGGNSGSFLAAMNASIVNVSSDVQLSGVFLHGKYEKTFYNDNTSILNVINNNGFDSI